MRISQSQGRYLRTGQHKLRINPHTDIETSSGIRTHDPSVRADEDGSCLRSRCRCDRQATLLLLLTIQTFLKASLLHFPICAITRGTGTVFPNIKDSASPQKHKTFLIGHLIKDLKSDSTLLIITLSPADLKTRYKSRVRRKVTLN
jgi:hypothetical protein